ncbi:MAG: cation:proton antiporter [Pyrinomonadaceae bacterium]
MHTPQLFTDLLIILLVSVPVAYLCLRVKLPLLVGLMLTGMAIGPFGIGLIKDLQGIEVLSEIGVMLLLFTIGLEFSIKRLSEMKRIVLIGGGLQVIVTTALVAAVFTSIGRPVKQAVFFGFLVALSSTAIVLKSYVDRNEIDAPHGRAGVGILLFQDISIVFMLLAIPLLGGDDVVSITRIAIDLGSALLALVLIVVGAWFLLPKFLHRIVPLKSPEVFLLTVVLFGLGMSWVTSHFGLPLALGGFIAGVVLADSEYNHQVTTEVLPFRDVFNSLFFVSIGLLLSLTSLISNIGVVLAVVLALVAGKAFVVWVIIRVLGYPQRVAAMVGLGLAQIGEFSFVLAKAGKGVGLFDEADYQIFLAASVISMIATPFLIAAAPRLAQGFQSLLSDGNRRGIQNVEDEDIHMTSSGGLQQHTIIIGYGLNGRNLSRVLRAVGIPYVVLELNAEVVKRAKDKGEKINFGDSTRREVLSHAAIDKAWSLVLAISDPHAARRTVKQARSMNPNLHIVVRTRYVAEIPELFKLGATEVIPEEFETSIEIFARVLTRYGTPRNVIEGQIDRIRQQGYEMLRTQSIPAPIRESVSVLDTALTESVFLMPRSPAIDKTLGELDLRSETGATVIAVIRDGNTKVSPGADYQLKERDTVILVGTPTKLQNAMNVLAPADLQPEGFNA